MVIRDGDPVVVRDGCYEDDGAADLVDWGIPVKLNARSGGKPNGIPG